MTFCLLYEFHQTLVCGTGTYNHNVAITATVLVRNLSRNPKRGPICRKYYHKAKGDTLDLTFHYAVTIQNSNDIPGCDFYICIPTLPHSNIYEEKLKATHTFRLESFTFGLTKTIVLVKDLVIFCTGNGASQSSVILML